MKPSCAVFFFLAFLGLISACTGSKVSREIPLVSHPSGLSIAGLGPCTDELNQTLDLNLEQPVTVLVHGCRGSAGNFGALAEVFAFHGQQAVCFSYNDRDSLSVSSAHLSRALDSLSRQMKNPDITVIGHSQGGLLSRKALVSEHPQSGSNSALNFRLVTISAPFAGVSAASHCGSVLGRVLSLGLTVPICKIVTGDKWFEITRFSEFIQAPGTLSPQVRSYLKISTDELGSCRQRDGNGDCVEDDYVFSLSEQYLPAIDNAMGLTSREIKAGHVEIVGNAIEPPQKLIAILQQEGILAPTKPELHGELKKLLDKLYVFSP